MTTDSLIKAAVIQGVGGVYLFDWKDVQYWARYHACNSNLVNEDGRHVCDGYVVTTDDREEALEAFEQAESLLRRKVVEEPVEWGTHAP